MIKNTQLTDLGAVSAEFPYGFPKIESSTGLNDGTRFDDKYMNDMYQLFQRAAALSGITPNELLDNAVNGYQLFDACFGTPKVPITTFYNGYYNSDETFINPLRVWKEKGGRELRIEGWIRGGNAGINLTIFQLPVGYRPTKVVNSLIVGYGVNQSRAEKIRYNNVTFNVEIETVIGELSSLGYINWSIPLD